MISLSLKLSLSTLSLLTSSLLLLLLLLLLFVGSLARWLVGLLARWFVGWRAGSAGLECPPLTGKVFDSLATFDLLKEVGVSEALCNAVSEAVADFFQDSIDASQLLKALPDAGVSACDTIRVYHHVMAVRGVWSGASPPAPLSHPTP